MCVCVCVYVCMCVCVCVRVWRMCVCVHVCTRACGVSVCTRVSAGGPKYPHGWIPKNHEPRWSHQRSCRKIRCRHRRRRHLFQLFFLRRSWTEWLHTHTHIHTHTAHTRWSALRRATKRAWSPMSSSSSSSSPPCFDLFSFFFLNRALSFSRCLCFFRERQKKSDAKDVVSEAVFLHGES